MRSLRLQEHPAGQADDRANQPDVVAPTLSEIFPETAQDPAAVAYMLSRLPKTDAPVLWVQDRLSRRESGKPYLAGSGTERPILRVDLSRATDVLWAMEDGLRCHALGAVIGEIWGDPPALDFTATKRLAMRAEAASVPCWLIRRAGATNLSAARDRWRAASRPSATNPHDAQAPGLPRWSLELFRSRRLKPGSWVAEYDRSSDRLYHAATPEHGALGTGDGTPRNRAAG
jgi:protein ImuA